MTFKTNIYQICGEVASEFEGWHFVAGSFKNKTLKHTDLIVDPGLYFKGGGCETQPIVSVVNKKAEKLCKKIVGLDLWMLRIRFDSELEKYYSSSSRVAYIYPENFPSVDMHGNPTAQLPTSFIPQAQAKDFLRDVLNDGISIFKKYFDLSSEENFLNHLPTGFKQREAGYVENAFYEYQGGIVLCIAALVRGDFDFVERYASDDFKTLAPKRAVELQKILAALPDLKRKYAETGSVI